MKDRIHLVLDLETLDIVNTAAVLSIGFALVRNCEVATYNEYRLKLDSQIQRGRTVSASTIQWWLDGQKPDAQKILANLPEVHVQTAMTAMTAALHAHGGSWDKVLVWGNSPSFDCEILAHLLMDEEGYYGKPWKYYNERDLRTLRSMSSIERHAPRIPHSAMWDAVAEAEDLCAYLKEMP